MKKDTSWNNVADWYYRLLSGEKTYQKEVILPNLLRLLNLKKGETVLDLACGPGFFAREFLKFGARVFGVDLSRELIGIAKENVSGAEFYAGSADKMPFIKNQSIDKITVILAIQNLENLNGLLSECRRVLKPGGRLFIVMNHPAFRIPESSSWDWDEKNKIQYRRIGRYLSEAKNKIQMHPGDKPGEYTISFHRPLQVYFKALKKNNFCVCGLEEWISNKTSQSGPRAQAEDLVRKEIPLFLFLEAKTLA